ncbi:MAG: guanylate kinase [Flavobacteriales bacterium]|nr:guanylate kinase [Flavobacteriales bacterium]
MPKCIIICAPSGAGKTTIVHYLLKQNKNLQFSVSATTRQKRENEQHGKDYYFITVEEFKKNISENKFVEWEEVYEGTYYGTLKKEIERCWNNGHHVVFDVDVEGGLNLKKYFGEKAIALFIHPPSLEVLKQRLQKRGTETSEKIESRIVKAEKELAYAPLFTHVIMNNQLEVACEETLAIIDKFLNE